MPITLTKPNTSASGGGIKLNAPNTSGAPTLEQIQGFQEKSKSLPLSSDPHPGSFAKNLETSGKDVSTGLVASGLKMARNTASMFQGLGQRLIAGFTTKGKKGMTQKEHDQAFQERLKEVKATTGFKSLDDSTPEGQSVAKALEPTNVGEKTGDVIGTVASLVSPFASETGGIVGLKNDINAIKNVPKTVSNIFGGENRELQNLVDETTGVADKKARISTLEKTGAIGKDGKPIGGAKETLLGGVKAEPTPADIARAKSVQGIVKPGVSPITNLTKLNQEISRISEKELAPALEKAGSINPINEKTPGWNKITQRLKDIEKPDIIKSDPSLDKTYDLVRQRMIEQIQKQPPTVKGLWEARKSFDKVVEDQFGDAAFNSEKNTAIKRAISDMRREVNSIIGDRVPQYKDQLAKLSDMYEARYNIAENFQNILDQGGWARFKTLNPKMAASLKWGSGAVGLGAAEKIFHNATGLGI